MLKYLCGSEIVIYISIYPRIQRVMDEFSSMENFSLVLIP